MMSYQLDFNAVLLDQEAIKQLNVLLIPTDILHKDVRSVAGILGFSIDEIDYIKNKNYPFAYMYDQWLKRHKRDAKLSTLLAALQEIKRYDAAEIVEKAVENLHQQDPKDVLRVEERYFSTLQRSISCATLSFETPSLIYDKEKNASGGANIPNLLLPQLMLENPETKAPDVFVVYYPENERHVEHVKRFILLLRKNGIDATTDMFDASSAKDRGFYIFSKLLESQFVFVVCSENFEKYSRSYAESPNEKAKDVQFTMNMILKEIYDNFGKNGKFIPILMPHGDENHIPFILKGATIYKMRADFKDLKRRVFGIEKYKLAPLPATRPKLKPKILGDKFGLFR